MADGISIEWFVRDAFCEEVGEGCVGCEIGVDALLGAVGDKLLTGEDIPISYLL